MPATSTSAWTTSPSPTMISPWRSGRAGCTAISRATRRYAECDLLGFGISAIGQVGPDLQPERQDPGRVLRPARPRHAAGHARYRADRRRPGAARADPIADVPLRGADRVPGDRAPDRFPQVLRATRSKTWRRFREAGLLTLDRQWLTVTPLGRFFIRNICMVFDRYLREGRERAHYSKVL